MPFLPLLDHQDALCERCETLPRGNLAPFPEWCSECFDNYDPTPQELISDGESKTLQDAFRSFAQSGWKKIK